MISRNTHQYLSRRSLIDECCEVQCGHEMWPCLTRSSNVLMQHENSQQGTGTHRAIVQEGLPPLPHGLGREDKDVRHHGAAARSTQHTSLSLSALGSTGQPSTHKAYHIPALSPRPVPPREKHTPALGLQTQ